MALVGPLTWERSHAMGIAKSGEGHLIRQTENMVLPDPKPDCTSGWREQEVPSSAGKRLNPVCPEQPSLAWGSKSPCALDKDILG